MYILFIFIGIIIFVVILVIFSLVYSKLIRKVGPNEAMIVYGIGGTKVIVGGAEFVIPAFQGAKYFSLELMSFTVDLVQEIYLAEQETYVNVQSVVLIKVRTSEPDFSPVIERSLSNGQATREELLRAVNENSAERSILKAAELFLDKSQFEREELIRIVIEGHLRGIIGQSTFAALVKDPEDIAQAMFKTTAPDLDRMGLEMISFTMKGLHRQNFEQAPKDHLERTNEHTADRR